MTASIEKLPSNVDIANWLVNVKNDLHKEDLVQHLSCLLSEEKFADVTIMCEGRSLKCHKMFLSRSSSVFSEMLTLTPCKHPVIFLADFQFWEVQAIVEFMYKGEVHVEHSKVPRLLQAANKLKVKGIPPSLNAKNKDDGSIKKEGTTTIQEDSSSQSECEPSQNISSAAQQVKEQKRKKKRKRPIDTPRPIGPTSDLLQPNSKTQKTMSCIASDKLCPGDEKQDQPSEDTVLPMTEVIVKEELIERDDNMESDQDTSETQWNPASEVNIKQEEELDVVDVHAFPTTAQSDPLSSLPNEVQSNWQPSQVSPGKRKNQITFLYKSSICDATKHLVIKSLLPAGIEWPKTVSTKKRSNHILSKVPVDNTGKRRKKRCRECSKKGKRKDVIYFCPDCPDEPGLCFNRCFNKFHESL